MMLTLAFCTAAGERAAKSAAQALLLLLVGDVAFDAFTFAWLPALGVAAGAAVLSVLTSIASYGIGPSGSPSLVPDPPAAGRHAAP